MDSALSAWLEDIFDAQLLVGIDWLRRSIQSKRSGIKPDPGWQGLYQDNGSCLEIITNDAEDRVLQVIKDSPLIVSDGHLYVEASLTSQCQQDFVNRHPKDRRPPANICPQLYSLIVVRKFNIRATSYGPPSDRIHLVIDCLDWERGPHAQIVGRPTPCTVSVTIARLLSRLEHTRAIEDSKYASEAPTLPNASMSQHNPIQLDAEDADMLDNSFDMSNTDFATQAYPELATQLEARGPRRRSRGGGSERSMEPIMMGHVRSRELRPQDEVPHGRGGRSGMGRTNAKTPTKGNMALLNLIQRKDPKSNDRRTPVRHQPDKDRDMDSSSSDSDTRKSLAKPPTGIWAEASVKGRAKANEKSTSPAVRLLGSPQKVPPQGSEPLPAMDTARAEADWLTDWHFDSESARVPSEQIKLLVRQDSWHKPPPGFRFTDGSMPIHTYQEILDLVEEQPETEGDEEEMDIDNESDCQLNIDQGGVEEQEQGFGLADQDEEDLSDAVSWSSSPAPQTPKLPSKANNNLPPDSSYEAAQPVSAQKTVQQAERSISPDPVHIQDPASSPPIPAGTNNSTEDMDMEIDVPQGLGEDQLASTSAAKLGATVMPSPMVPRHESVIQVKDTPFAKARDGRPLPFAMAQVSSQNQTSSGTSRDTSLTSIVFGTYNDPTSSEYRQPTNVETGFPNVSAGVSADVSADGFSTRKLVPIVGTKTGDVSMADISPRADQKHPQPSATGENAAPMPPIESEDRTGPQTVQSGALAPSHRFTTKRKSSGSPSKPSPRHAKRREIKLSGFSQHSPPSQDPETAYRHHKKEFVQKLREDRVQEPASTTPPSRPKPHPPTQSPAVDSAQSPIENFKTLQLADATKKLVEASARTPQASVSVSPRHARGVSNSTPPLSKANKSLHIAHDDDGMHTPQAHKHPIKIFDQFKATYPEYSGDREHFIAKCREMYDFEQEDKMVPKSQWDDYLIRSRTDYRDYMMRCVDISRDPEPYLRFYKDHISDRIYDKGVLKDQNTLFTALEQLGHTPSLKSPAQRNPVPARAPRPKRPSVWDSLLGPSRSNSPQVFPQTAPAPDQRPTKDTRRSSALGSGSTSKNREVPRRPTYGSPKTIGTLSSMTNSTVRQNPPPPVSRKSNTNGFTDGREPYLVEKSDDTIQDLVVGHQKLTSWTGSTSVRGNMKWPSNLAIRPATTRPTRPDVLSWKDEL